MNGVIYGVTVVEYLDGKIVNTFTLDDYSQYVYGAWVIADDYIKAHSMDQRYKIERRATEYYFACDLLNDDGSIAFTFVTTRKELK